MATIEELTAAAQTAIDALKTANGGDGMFAQVNNERREFTDAEYDQAVQIKLIAILTCKKMVINKLDKRLTYHYQNN